MSTNLGGLLFAQNRFDESLPLFEQACDSFRDSGTTDSPSFERALSGAAYSRYNAGAYEAAIPYLEELLPLRGEQHPAGDPAVFEVARILRDCLQETGDHLALMEMLESVHQTFEQAVGADQHMTRSLAEWLDESRLAVSDSEADE